MSVWSIWQQADLPKFECLVRDGSQASSFGESGHRVRSVVRTRLQNLASRERLISTDQMILQGILKQRSIALHAECLHEVVLMKGDGSGLHIQYARDFLH